MNRENLRSVHPFVSKSLLSRGSSRAAVRASCLLALAWASVACTPTVTVEAPTEPIVINMNIKIEHEIKVKVDKDLEDLFEDDEALF